MTESKPSDQSVHRDAMRHLINNTINVAGMSVITTITAITAHHLWRKNTNPNAKITDYVFGIANQLQKIETSIDNKKNDTTPSQASTVKLVEWVSGVANKSIGIDFDDFSVVGINKSRQVVWQTQLPERVHDIVVQNFLPAIDIEKASESVQHLVVMGRRPSEHFWIIDCSSGELLHTIQAETNRHFYGHACYSLNGTLLYVTENNIENFNGLIGVYDVAKDYEKVDEFATYGIGPHELILHPDGQMLVVANGGIKTERASREELNLDSMQPSLVYLSLKAGEEGKVLQQVEPYHNQMSVRHISAIKEGNLRGTIAIGIQFQGEKHLNMPLVLTHQFGDKKFTEYKTNNDEASWRQFHHYIASVGVNSATNLICATSPIGGCVSVFDMINQRMIDTIKIADCAGVSTYGNGFIVSDGQGGLTVLDIKNGKLVADTVTLSMAFDNHMQVVK